MPDSTILNLTLATSPGDGDFIPVGRTGGNRRLHFISGVSGILDAGNYIAGTVGVDNGGTNITSYSSGDILYATNSNTLAKLAAGTSGQILAMGAAYPNWIANAGGAAGGQPADGTLTGLSNVSVSADKLIYATGVDQFGTVDFLAAGRSLVAADSPAAQRLVMDAAALGSANAFTATNDFVYAPSITRSQLSPSLLTGNSTLNVGECRYDTVVSGRTILFAGTPVEGSEIQLKLSVTGSPTLTIPTSKRIGESDTPITSLGLYPGLHNLLWRRINSEWVLSDTVGIYNNLTGNSAPTVNSDSTLGYSINSRWINTGTDIVYDCTDNTSGVALWRENINAQAPQTLYNKTVGSGWVTSIGSDATGDLYYRGTEGAFTRLGIGSAGYVLTSSGGLPSWAASAGGGLTGVVPVASGGTNLTSYTSGDLIYASAETTLSKLGIGSNGQALTIVGNQLTWGTVTGVAGSGLSDPGANGILKRTSLNSTAIAVTGVDYYAPFSVPASIGISIDGGGAVPSTGIKGYVTVPYSCTITGYNITADQATPSGTFDVWKVAEGTVLPTVANTIMGTKPSLSVGNAVRSNSVGDWQRSITGGSILGFTLDSVASGYKWNFQLEVIK